MIAWREEGERSVAMLGEIQVGYVLASKSWGFKWYSMLAPNDLAYSSLSAAKAALAEAVGEWCARAGLMSAADGVDVLVARAGQIATLDGETFTGAIVTFPDGAPHFKSSIIWGQERMRLSRFPTPPARS